eukprot:c27150_g3_i1 orf=767-2713(+)
MLGDPDAFSLVQTVINTCNEMTMIRRFRKSQKKECMNLVRRVKLMVPLFEEVKELQGPLPGDAITSILAVQKVFQSANDLLHFCSEGSKLYLVLESEAVSSKFRAVTGDLDKALDSMPYDLLDVSDEVREQIQLVHSQLKRAKCTADSQDIELIVDIMIVASQKEDEIEDPDVLHRLADKLQLGTHSEINAEMSALQRLIEERSIDDESLEEMFKILRKLRGLLEPEIVETDTVDLEKVSLSSVTSEKPSTCVIPDDFRCPVSLELMKDPVIVASGQTYDRAYIQRWLDAGHKTCPKSQQVLPHLVLTPNYVLRSLIAQWCESNGIEVPKRAGPSQGSKLCSDAAAGDSSTIDVLLQKLRSGQIDAQRAATGELRLLAKRSAENRVCIADAGAIPLLVGLLSTEDLRTQENAVTALLNLSIHDNNKGAIVQAGAIGPIVEVLKHGHMEARENAAATLFSLSVVDENKVTIGATGAIPALVDLLRDGSSRGKKDAATALFNLSIYQGNKARAVRAGVVGPLMNLIVNPISGMVDEALAILAILATHQEGRIAIGNAFAIPVLVELIRSGSSRNKENAAAVLLALSTSDPNHLVTARQLGAYQPLTELAQSGTARARRKATALLEHMNRQEMAGDAFFQETQSTAYRSAC